MQTWKKIVALSAVFLIIVTSSASAQLIGLALSLGNTLASYVFGLYLRNEQVFELDGAPDWYGHNDDKDWDCAFGYSPGTLAAVESAKTLASEHLVKQQEQTVQAVIREEIQKRKPRNLEEQALVAEFRHDPELQNFVHGKQEFIKIKYDDSVQAAFVKVCLQRSVIVDYQQERLKRITDQISQHRAKSAFDELSETLNQTEAPFEETVSPSPSAATNPYQELDQALDENPL